MKQCPYCAEEIQADAIKCKHCGEWINKTSFISKFQFLLIPFRIFKKRSPTSEMSKKYISLILTKIVRGIVLFIGFIVVVMLSELSKLVIPVSGVGGGIRGGVGFWLLYLLWKKVLPKINIGSQMSETNEEGKDQSEPEPEPEPPKPVELTEEEKVRRREKNRKYVRINKIVLGLFLIGFVLVLILDYIDNGGSSSINDKDKKLYQDIVENSYESNEEFDFYIDKFYRDIGVYGIIPIKPTQIIIKFSRLDQMLNTTHYHAVSYGIDNDDKIEIYINPSTWNNFNKPMRYYLMYHELAHDVLNLDDLDARSINQGKLMYPVITSYERKTMDDFIESSHALFEELSTNY